MEAEKCEREPGEIQARRRLSDATEIQIVRVPRVGLDGIFIVRIVHDGVTVSGLNCANEADAEKNFDILVAEFKRGMADEPKFMRVRPAAPVELVHQIEGMGDVGDWLGVKVASTPAFHRGAREGCADCDIRKQMIEKDRQTKRMSRYFQARQPGPVIRTARIDFLKGVVAVWKKLTIHFRELADRYRMRMIFYRWMLQSAIAYEIYSAEALAICAHCGHEYGLHHARKAPENVGGFDRWNLQKPGRCSLDRCRCKKFVALKSKITVEKRP